MKRGWMLAITATLACAGCDQMMGASDVEHVKNGMLSLDKTTTIGRAFDGYKYFTGTEWTAGQDKQGRRNVMFLGHIAFDASKCSSYSMGRQNEPPPFQQTPCRVTGVTTVIFSLGKDNSLLVRDAKVQVAMSDDNGKRMIDVARADQDLPTFPDWVLKTIYENEVPPMSARVDGIQ